LGNGPRRGFGARVLGYYAIATFSAPFFPKPRSLPIHNLAFQI
jgi:hypothetical protein